MTNKEEESEIELIHPYNYTLQILDSKISELVGIYSHLASIPIQNGKNNDNKTERDYHFNTVKTRLCELERARKLIWEIGLNQTNNNK